MSIPSEPSTSTVVERSAMDDHTMPGSKPRRRRRRALAGMLAPLRYRDFRLLFGGQLISVLGDTFYAVALPWLVFANGGTARDLGLVLAAYGLPRVVTVLVGGWLSDRLRPRRVMLGTDSARMLLMAGLGALALWSHPPLWQLCAVLAAEGAFSGLFIPASWAITPDVLPDEVLQAGNSLTLAWTQLANLAGPGIAGIIVARFNSAIALLADALTFAVSALTLGAMRGGGGHAKAAHPSSGTMDVAGAGEAPAAREGGDQPTLGFWRFLRGSRLFQLILLLSVLLNLVLGGVLEVGLPALAHGPLRAGASGYGTMVASFGAGALMGALSGGVLARLPHRGVVNLLIWAAQGLAVAAIPFGGSVRGAVAALVVMGLCNGLGNVSFITLVQQYLPRHLMGRFMGALGFANYGLFPISVALAGFALTAIGPAPLITGAGLLTLVGIVGVLIPPDIRGL
jgi:hypothetical protein